MAGRERDWMDYAMLGSSLAQNSQLSGIGDQLAALKQAESQKQFAEFEVTVLRQILFRIEDRIHYFAKQASYPPQGRMLGLMKVAEVLAAFRDPSLYRNYEDKDRHTALNAKVDEAVGEIARSLPPAELAELNEAVAWQRTKLQLLARAMQQQYAMETYNKEVSQRPILEAEHRKKQAEWQVALGPLKPKLAPLERQLEQIRLEGKKLTKPKVPGCFMAVIVFVVFGMACNAIEAKHEGVGSLLLLVSAGWVGWRCYSMSKPKSLRERKKHVKAEIAAILATIPVEPTLPPAPTAPSDEGAVQFLQEQNLGPAFSELKTVFTDKRALVERVLEADAALCKELNELDSRALLQRTTQEVAAKMGLTLPPQLAISATA